MSMSNGIFLACVYRTENIWTMNDIYICEGTVFFTGHDRIINGLTGNHLANKTSIDVEGFSIREQRLRFFPRNLHEFFPNIDAIRVRDTGLSEISNEDIKNLPLKQISFSLNNFRTINASLFASNPELQAISFDYNPVMHVAHDVFDGLINLTRLRFLNTTCMDQIVDGDVELVERMVFEISRQCPPTSRMIAEELGTTQLKEKVSKQKNKISELEAKVLEHERRIEALESEAIGSTVSTTPNPTWDEPYRKV